MCPFVLEGHIPHPRGIQELGWLCAGTLQECSCTESYWRELDYGGCSFWVLLILAVPTHIL